MSPEDELTRLPTPEERARRVHRNLVRSAVIWTPPFLLCLGLLIFFAWDQSLGEERGSWFLVGVLVIATVLFGSQSIQALLDLAGEPRELVGEVTRRWARSDSLVVRTHYMRIGKQIMRGDREILDDVKVGDHVAVRFYGHSGVVITVEKREAPVPAPAGPPADGGKGEPKAAAKAPAPAPTQPQRVRNRRSVEPPKF